MLGEVWKSAGIDPRWQHPGYLEQEAARPSHGAPVSSLCPLKSTIGTAWKQLLYSKKVWKFRHIFHPPKIHLSMLLFGIKIILLLHLIPFNQYIADKSVEIDAD